MGARIEPWQRGRLDIHQISTGRGNAALTIFPDGTTLLVDAGAYTRDVPDAAARPDDSRPPGEWIARYVRQMLPAGAEPALDYALITHFHPDHMGWASDADPMASAGAYRLRGITRVAEQIPIRTMDDRAWPDYDFPFPLVPVLDQLFERTARQRRSVAGVEPFDGRFAEALEGVDVLLHVTLDRMNQDS